MFKWGKFYIAILLPLVLLTFCTKTKDNNEDVIARVGDRNLLQSEVSQIIPGDMEKQDSILMVNDYIRKWVKEELLIQKAEENLSPAQKNLTREIEEYRNSLIIYKYKNELMNQQMDTLVTKEQIEEYYSSNRDNFKLSHNIVRAIFLKIPIELAKTDLIKNLVQDDSEEGKNALREYCIQYAKSFDFFNNNWVNFRVVKNNVPEPIEDEQRYLSRNNQIEITDSAYYYLVNIRDHKLAGEPAPVEYVERNIRNLILNKRKIDFLKQVEDNIYKEGIRQNKFEIYSN